jgi:ribosomal protein L11 methyltransferase
MAVRKFTLQPVQDGADFDALLMEALDGFSVSWMENPGGSVTLWAESSDSESVRESLSASAIVVLSEIDEVERDWVEESASLRKAVAVGKYLFDPHDGERAKAPGNHRRLFLPAARAFGTGSHESTRLAIRLLQSVEVSGLTVADAGCGAGTLAFVASLEGAVRVVAFDLDPDAAFATREHARENSIAGVLPFAGTTTAFRSSGPWADLVVANMLREELVPVLGDLAAVLKPAGVLLTSGQLVVDEGGFTSELSGAGFEVFLCLKENEWLGTASRKRRGESR